jgi:hypothetical protein
MAQSLNVLPQLTYRPWQHCARGWLDSARGYCSVSGQIAAIIHRPMLTGHLGKWIAEQIFEIDMERTATLAIDGRFVSGPLRGRTVDVKWRSRRKGLLAVSASETVDYYLVLTGPPAQPGSSRDITLPLCIESVYLFDSNRLRAAGVKPSNASSVPPREWELAEIYPHTRNSLLEIRPEQAELLRLFAPD